MKRSVEVHLGEIEQRLGTLHYNQDGNRGFFGVNTIKLPWILENAF